MSLCVRSTWCVCLPYVAMWVLTIFKQRWLHGSRFKRRKSWTLWVAREPHHSLCKRTVSESFSKRFYTLHLFFFLQLFFICNSLAPASLPRLLLLFFVFLRSERWREVGGLDRVPTSETQWSFQSHLQNGLAAIPNNIIYGPRRGRTRLVSVLTRTKEQVGTFFMDYYWIIPCLTW